MVGHVSVKHYTSEYLGKFFLAPPKKSHSVSNDNITNTSKISFTFLHRNLTPQSTVADEEKCY